MRLLPSRRPADSADHAQVTLRASSGTPTMIALIAAMVLLLVDAAIRGQWVVLLVSLPPLATIVWVVWILIYHPCIRYDDDAMEIVNVGRITRMPWPRIVDLTMRFQVVAQLEGDTKVVSWGGPTMARKKPPRRNPTIPAPVRPSEVNLLLDAWHAHEGEATREPVSRRADGRALAVGVLLAIVVILEAAVAAFLGTLS